MYHRNETRSESHQIDLLCVTRCSQRFCVLLCVLPPPRRRLRLASFYRRENRGPEQYTGTAV